MTSNVRCTAVRHRGLITMHLGRERTGDYPHLKLPALLDELSRKKDAFVTVSDLIREKNSQR